MKRSCQILCVTVAISTVSAYVIEYVGGRKGMFLSVAMLPAQIIPDLISLICIATLFVFLIVALTRRKNRKFALFAFCLSVFFFAMAFAIMPAKIFQLGFRHRIRSTISPDELRSIARFVHANIPMEESLPDPEKNLWNEDKHRSLWSAITAATEVEKLDPVKFISNGPNSVTVTWGGALVGHWGLIIEISNGEIRSDAKGGDIAPDIKTFISPD